ncbi:hypothetical protein [Streptomyces flavalbus]|uniref:Uncharacterized protein n=1 Tax=Streptomyces flavalbus TaxID=2665155 RepID=A0ABW2W069_9ACTN
MTGTTVHPGANVDAPTTPRLLELLRTAALAALRVLRLGDTFRPL